MWDSSPHVRSVCVSACECVYVHVCMCGDFVCVVGIGGGVRRKGKENVTELVRSMHLQCASIAIGFHIFCIWG